MADVYIDLDQLETVVTQLDNIIAEFENAKAGSEQLESDIGSPFGRSALKDKAREFEERWDDKRKGLQESLVGVRDHVQGVVDGVNEWDAETAIALEPAE